MFERVRDVFDAEPAVVLGSAAAFLQAVAEAVAGAYSWKAAVPLLVAFAIRKFVYAPANVEPGDDTEELDVVQ